MAYYAIVEPTPVVSSSGRRCPGVMTEDEERANIAAVYAWREYISQLLERPIPIQLFPRHFHRGTEVRRMGFIVRLTDHEAFLCLIGDTPSRLITRVLLESVGDVLSEDHKLELADWCYRQQQLQQRSRTAIERDHENGHLTDDQYTELIARLSLDEQFVQSQTKLPMTYVPHVYDPSTHTLIGQKFTVRINGTPVSHRQRDDLTTIAIDRNASLYLDHVSDPKLRFETLSDELLYYRNVIPWHADDYVDELITELNINPDRVYLSVVDLTPNTTVAAVDLTALNRVKAGEQANVLYIPKMSARWTNDNIQQLLRFFDPEHHRDIKVQWWLTYDHPISHTNENESKRSTEQRSTEQRYYMNLTITFPPERHQAGLFKFMFSPLRFDLPNDGEDYRLDQHRWPDTTDDGIIYYHHQRLHKQTVVNADVFKRQAALGLPTNRSYDSLRRLYDRLTDSGPE